MTAALNGITRDGPLSIALEEQESPELPKEKIVTPAEQRLRDLILRRFLEMDNQYFTWWLPTHTEIVQYIWPNRSEFFQFETNKGYQRDLNIFDNSASIDGRKLTSFLDTCLTNEARTWFTVAPEDPRDAEQEDVAEYCHTVQDILFSILGASNFHPSNRNVLDDLVGVATGALLIESDDEDVVRFTHLPSGTYRTSTGSKGQNNRLARRFTFTAVQMVEEFGEENCSSAVRMAASKNQTVQTPFQVIQVIEPRAVRDPRRKDAKNKPWASYWVEVGAGVWGANNVAGLGTLSAPAMAATGVLRESGFDRKPFVVARWNALGTDAYGKDSPGWTCLSDVKALQGLMVMGASTIGRIGDPPMNQPDELKNASMLPGARNPIPSNSKAKFEPSVMIPPEAVTVMREEKQEHRQRITSANYGDVIFLVSNGGENKEPASATEINAKKAEQLLQLGGVGNRISNEYLREVVSATFHYAQLAGRLPPPPPTLAKKGKIKIQFENPLITAQKTVGFGALQQWLSMAQACAEAKQAGADQPDYDEILRESTRQLGVNPKVQRAQEQLDQERQANKDAAAQQQQAAALQAGAPAVKQLSDANPDRLSQLLGQGGPLAQVMGSGKLPS